MKLKASLLALFAAGLVASVAIAGPAPGKGKPPGKGKGGAAPTTTAGGSTTTTTPSGKKVQVCHRSGGKTNPRYRLITVSRNALKGHMRHGDVLPVNGQCPGTTSTTTTTVSTSTTISTSTSTTSTSG